MNNLETLRLLKRNKAKVFHLRAMAHYLGLPERTVIPMKKEDAEKYICDYAAKGEEESERVKYAVKVIINRMSPTAVSNSSTPTSVKNEVMDKAQAYNTISSILHDQYNDRESKLNETFKGFEKEVNSTVERVQKLNREDAIKAIREEAKKFRTVQVKVGTKKAKQIKSVLPKEFDTLVQLAQQRKNIMMVGPAGCGKTYLSSKVAEALDLDYGSQSCSEGMSESQLTGWLLPVGASGKFTYVSSEFVRIYEKGGVFLLDEIDASDPNVLIIINQALANDHFTIPQRHNNPIVKKHKNFVAMAAANTFGNGADAVYVGRNQLDAATLDRFRVGTVTMDYDELVEQSLTTPEVYEWGINIRNKIREHGLRRIMSTRVMKDATDMVEGQGWTLEQVEKSYFSDWSREERSIIGLTA